MDSVAKLKEWVNEKAPFLAVIYQNKYVGMLYDRFASLPPKQQRQVIGGIFGVTSFTVVGYLLWSYISLWSVSSQTSETYAMSNMLQQYQKSRRDRSQQLQLLSLNSQLGSPGVLKQYLIEAGRPAGISQRMVQVEERGEAGVGDDPKAKKEVKIKQATVSLQRINLTQLSGYLKGIEFGKFNVGVSSLKIINDDKLRGYLTAEISVMAYLFESDESNP